MSVKMTRKGPKIRQRRKKIGIPAVASVFTPEKIFAAAAQLKSGKWPAERVRWTDDVVPGLRYVINSSGLVTAHVSYEVDKFRGLFLLGSLNKEADNHLTIEEARKLARVVQELAEGGIDIQDGLHARLIKELKKEGTAWRPK